jgi:hypothetical protein
MARNHLFTQRIWKAPAVRWVRHAASPRRVYRYLSAAQRCLPDYIIVGAQKAGTTSLWAYLSEHPLVAAPITKEVSFFDVNFHRGINWYRMHFPHRERGHASLAATGQIATGESTPYYMFHPLVPERIAATLPSVKIIILLRDPVDRAFSHYQLKIKRRHETLTFEEAIDAEAGRLAGEHEKILDNPPYYSRAHDRFSYLARGLYLEQILRWQQLFPPDQLLILESGDLFRRTSEVFERTLDFLGIPPGQPRQFGNRYPGNYKEKMSPAMQRKLAEYFSPHNERLYAHLGVRFNWKSN